ncbi:hypothetical protein M0813_13547 [Anaeramoeba flamelloides]|uniref:Uncharacterized protein n=1 Tax=Anaeramoeba flamelloides TaxID=1746091 RepID=A0ABQ8Z837_9EUKA|nr:hypothetical protein M0813_13547 [Anaeramoeba flamelloides]
MKSYLFLIALLVLGSFVFCGKNDDDDDTTSGNENKYTMWLYSKSNCEGSRNGSYQFQRRERKRARNNKLYEIEIGSGDKFQFRRCHNETDDCEEVTTFELGECKPIDDLDEETKYMLFADEEDSWGDTKSFEFSGSYITRFSLIFFAFSIFFFFI